MAEKGVAGPACAEVGRCQFATSCPPLHLPALLAMADSQAGGMARQRVLCYSLRYSLRGPKRDTHFGGNLGCGQPLAIKVLYEPGNLLPLYLFVMHS